MENTEESRGIKAYSVLITIVFLIVLAYIFTYLSAIYVNANCESGAVFAKCDGIFSNIINHISLPFLFIFGFGVYLIIPIAIILFAISIILFIINIIKNGWTPSKQNIYTIVMICVVIILTISLIAFISYYTKKSIEDYEKWRTEHTYNIIDISDKPIYNTEGKIENIEVSFVFDPDKAFPNGEYEIENCDLHSNKKYFYPEFNYQHNSYLGYCEEKGMAIDNVFTIKIMGENQIFEKIKKHSINGPFIVYYSGTLRDSDKEFYFLVSPGKNHDYNISELISSYINESFTYATDSYKFSDFVFAGG